MNKTKFWKTDWFLGLIVVIAMVAVYGSDLMQSLERKAYDLGMQASSRTPSDKIAVIGIDKQSIDNIGRFPWRRDIHAKMVDILSAAQPKVIASNIFFSEPEKDPGLAWINKLSELYAKVAPPVTTSSPSGQLDPNSVNANLPATISNELMQIGTMLTEAEKALNTDRKLAESFAKAGNVVLPILFTPGQPLGNPDKSLPDFIRKNALSSITGKDGSLWFTSALEIPLVDGIGKSVANIGHMNLVKDVDGAIRTVPLVASYFNELYPALSTIIVAKSLNLGIKDIVVNLGEGIRIGNLKIRTDNDLQMHTFFYKDTEGKKAFQIDSYFDVYAGKIPAEKYRDKIVLIGLTGAGFGGNDFVTPVSALTPSILILANEVSGILQEHFFVVPQWSGWAELGIIVFIAIYLMFLLPRLKANLGAVITTVLFLSLLATHFVLMVNQAMWVQLMFPAALLLVGHALLTTKRFLVTEKGKIKSDAESAESNRMLGLAFQGQGQLDMAFDKFRRCPMSDALMENLYNLGLDFERKRQFNKAEAVFRYMADYNPKFKDLQQRLNRAKAASETVMLGGGRQSPGGTLILGGGETIEKPMLGRYQVEKEIGKGAMGVVYLGRDPKISRTVAIKTLALSQEFELEELEEVKQRFFREAETAGRLNHPHIVTIFDAGEEHDLAYIAMEFLKGKDLVAYTRPESILSIDKTMSIAARVADALDYAHKTGVIHRDIKPANIMWEEQTDTLKVTDFGIARITDSSKTKTGMVLGTPSYMSPEQLSGKKIDGRSDLFSLGVSLYQLASGRLPFSGDSMAQLMFCIANQPPVDILTINPKLPPCLVAIINKALTKDVNQRFQTGEEFATSLRECLSRLKNPSDKKSAVDIAL